MRRAKIRLAPWEIELIEELDDAYLAAQSSEAKSKAERQRAIKDGLRNIAHVVTAKKKGGGDG